MTTERLTEQQIEEKARSLQRMLCNDKKLFEQLQWLVRINRGGVIELMYDASNILQKVGVKSQI